MSRYFLILVFIMARCVVWADETPGPACSSHIVRKCDEGKADSRFLLAANPDENSPTGIYIPENLDECLTELDKMLHSEAKKYLSGNFADLTANDQARFQSVLGHMNLGRFLRDRWGLWGGGRLRRHFEKLGISHPDDMSGIILTSYRRYLRKVPVRLAEQIKTRRKYWKMAERPSPFTDPNTNAKIKAVDSRYYEGRHVHFGVNEKTGEIWFYEYDKGWYKPNEKALKDFRAE